ncbi:MULTISPECIES: hypothetical protein [unclassified Streptomyces]|uniref:hypothetical protein n=1 Tax=unclassified Streptomyces TaxID=2593676 RepID=UPI003402FE99
MVSLLSAHGPHAGAGTRGARDGAGPHGRPGEGGLRGEALGEVQLTPPPHLPAVLGCDAVGVPARHGMRLLSRLPGNGCVFADSDWWWWLVPAGSDADLRWPLPACYAPGGYVPDRRPRLMRRPGATSPYTPPIPLYLMVCQLTGTAPAWTVPTVRSPI